MPWSSEQLSWLQALGHVVYLDRDAQVEAPPAVVEAAPVMAAPAAAPRAEPSIAPPRRHAPAAPDTTAPTVAGQEMPTAAIARRPRAGLPDRLQIALLRASGLNPNDPATQTLMATWPLAELRGNPRAKRALWPQLRALRRRGRTPS